MADKNTAKEPEAITDEELLWAADHAFLELEAEEDNHWGSRAEQAAKNGWLSTEESEAFLRETLHPLT